MRHSHFLSQAMAIIAVWGTAAAAQTVVPPPGVPNRSPRIEKLGPSTYRIGSLQVDTTKREVVAAGSVNEVMLLEFVANPTGGAKAYECAVSLDTDAIGFNAALLLIGLDPSRAKVPTRQFDPASPQGDPVEIHVSWGGNRYPIEELLFDQRTKKTLRQGPWVYTGSTFVGSGPTRGFLADLDGVLIGLMHGPQALIENPRNDAVDGFGSIVLNPNIGLQPGTAITLTVRALPLSPAARR